MLPPRSSRERRKLLAREDGRARVGREVDCFQTDIEGNDALVWRRGMTQAGSGRPLSTDPPTIDTAPRDGYSGNAA